MKTDFRTQLTEYDCVPATFLNAYAFLFERNEIPTFVIQQTYRLLLDENKCHGTSREGVKKLLGWLNESSTAKFPIHAQYFRGRSVKNALLELDNQHLAAVLLRVKWSKTEWHYILVLSNDGDSFHCFDPYLTSASRCSDSVEHILPQQLHDPNLKIPFKHLFGKQVTRYSMWPISERECCILTRKRP